MKTKHSGLIMGPAAAPQAPAATKFWNMASTGDDEGGCAVAALSI